MEKIVFTRVQLYNLVWSDSLLSLSKKYNISDNGLRKICTKNDIPLPPSSYWQRVRNGAHLTKKKLPKEHFSSEITLELRDEERAIISPSPLTLLTKEIKGHDEQYVKVPKSLTNPNILIIRAKDCLLDKKRNWTRYAKVISSDSDVLDITVTSSNVDRALRIMDTFIKLLISRGHEVNVRNNSTYALVYGENIVFRLREKLNINKNPDPYSYDRYVGSGKLAFVVGNWLPKEFSDNKTLLEDKLSSVPAYMEIKAQEDKRQRLVREERNRKEQEQQKLQQEKKEQKEKELIAFKDLVDQANRLNQTKILRDYIR